MPIQFNEHILSSKTKSLEFIADKKYPTNILTQNEVAYSTNEWIIKTFSMTSIKTISSFLFYSFIT